MKKVTLKFRHKNKQYEHDIMAPESTSEAQTSIGEALAFKCLQRGYLAHMREVIAGIKKRPRKRIIKINLDKINAEQIETLEALGLLAD